ncbi:DUF3068 domain-containing protein [Salinispora mooreana]|uniref:DUF3068 domain-containing protein n=1 Tax=Salinispora mooreana TaxID=999545 RepID=UPI0004758144|nr:DUF3068 domain-containing protein [Salinispora mooreana]
MRQKTGAVLFGLGLLCVVAAVGLVGLIVPALKQVPYDVTPPDIVVVAPSATFVSARTLPGGEPAVTVETGTLRSETGIKPDNEAAAELTGSLAGETLIWNVYQATDWVDRDLPVNRAESRIALDRVSGAAAEWDGQCYSDTEAVESGTTGCEAGSITYAGQLYLFPFDTKKQTYQYFDGILRQSLPMLYQGEEEVAGLETYRFEQTVPQRELDLDEETLTQLLGFLAPEATTATMTYRASRTLWVEPMTGGILGYREQQHQELVPDVGSPVVIFNATFQYDDATADAVIEQARDGRAQLFLLGRNLPIGLLVAGVLAAAAGFMLVFVRRATATRPADATGGEPAQTS